MKESIISIFKKMEDEIRQEMEKVRHEGGLSSFPLMEYKIVGQMALLLADLPFSVASTTDIDILHQAPFPQVSQLKKNLLELGLILESDQHLIWMPKETIYHPFFEGKYAKVFYADPLFVIASKCKFKRKKDQVLIQDYFRWNSQARERIESMGIDTGWLKEKR